ncbi:amino acid adenylation domain-containing protein [Ornithinimicrobium faecis]|uniref:Amino acid adenylation domain-containing protein n=1 Tax=Ornithinimicrobium faecis TaxID=2934158 RepID=A0ABY4YXJ8_9MICO|nr:non-ribosomal peptide synthetase/MFS transporter [Ornithinimicrobium sp. HY1793]USQ80832.1 amino acid adenylation domain-containing protein [Ornithinimicrobium sp. HY1793]
MAPAPEGTAARAELVSERLRMARERRQRGSGPGQQTDHHGADGHQAGHDGGAHGTLQHRADLPPALSSAQRRLWFLSQLEPDSAAYLIPACLDLRGPLDLQALHRAWDQVVERHEVLRTRIVAQDGEPVPAVDSAPAGAWNVIEVDEVADPAALQRITDEEVSRPIDLSTEQPWRVTLVRSGPQQHRLLITLHHIASDGWSVSVLLRDLERAYRGENLTGSGLQVLDVTHYREGPEGAEGGRLSHWTEHLAGAPRLLELPTDRPRPATADPSGDTVRVPLDARAGRAVRELAAATGTTAYMVFLTGLHLVLGQWARTDDIVVGTPVAGRSRTEFEDLIGCFVNTVALRTRSSETDTVNDLLAHVRTITSAGLGHQAIGFEQVVEALGLERDVSTTPLYQVSLTVHTEPGVELSIPGVEATWLDVLAPVAKCDLGLHIEGGLLGSSDQSADDVTISVTYRTALFDRETVTRLVGHLEQAVRSMSQDPTQLLSEVCLLTEAELAELPAQVGADVAVPTPIGQGSVGDVVRSVAQRHPNRVAVTSRGEDLTYAELLARVEGVADRLRDLGIGRGDRIGLLVERSCDVVVGMLAAFRVGAAHVPLDPMYPDGRLAALIEAATPAVVLSQSHLLPRLPEATADRAVDLREVSARTPTDQTDEARGEDVAYVLFTSGTTGAPKGVQVEHRHLLAYLAGLREVIGVRDGWSWAMMTTPSADLGLTNLLGALTSGGRVHLLTYDEVTDPDTVAAYFRNHRIDAMKLVPSHLQALWDERDPTAVLPGTALILAGEPCPWELIDRVRAAAPGLAVHNHYGPSETTVSVMALPLAGAVRQGTVVPLGRPFPGTRAHVLDPAGRPVPVGVPGELVIAGPTVSRGYLSMPTETARAFVAEPSLTSTGPGGVSPGAGRDHDERAYRTGDLVRRRPSGDLEFLGRSDDQVKIRGYRVEPGGVALAVRECAGVEDCFVLVREDLPGQRTLVAYLTTEGPPDVFDLAAVREELRDRLPDYMVPSDLVPLPTLPLTANGKIDRAALPAPDVSLRRSGPAAALTGPTEHQVARVWQEILGLDELGAEDSFFDVGGDSFSAVRAVRALGSDVSVVDLFRSPTVRALAACIDDRAGGEVGEAGLLVSLGDRRGPAEVHVVCVPYGGGSPVTFAPLAEAMPDHIAVHGVDLPGHDTSRRDETPRPLVDVAADLVPEIQALGGDVVLYGHCLGGALAVETALQLEAAGTSVLGVVEAGTFPAARLPGRFARALDRVLPTDRLLSDRAYHDMLRSLGGFTDVVDPADRSFLIRALRHDAREAEGYYTDRYTDVEAGRVVPHLEAPLLCVVGDRDRATELYQERFAEWADFSQDVDLAVIDRAGHYFLKHQAEELTGVLRGTIDRWRRGERPRAEPATARAREASTRTFLLVAITQLLSMIGTGLTSFALGVWVLQETGSVSRFAMISVLAIAPAIVLSPVAGAVADRFDRRRVMILSDTAAGVATAALVWLLAMGQLELWFIYLFAGVGSVANAFQRPAYLAAVTQLVPKRYLGQANGLVTLGASAGDLIAALLGGILIGFFGLVPVVAIDATTFVLAFVVLLCVRFPDRLWIRREETFRAEIAGGWRYIVRRRPLVVMVVFFVVFNFLFAVPVVLATPLVLEGSSPQVLGAVLACGGIGALLGTLLMAVWGGTRRRALGMIGGTITLGLAVVLLGATTQPIVQGLAMLVTYGSLLVLNAHWLALIQTKVGLELQGRVLAINQMLAMSTMPFGFLVVGPLSDWVGDRAGGGPLGALEDALHLGSVAGVGLTLVATGVLITVWGVLGMSVSALRTMEDALPDALPDAEIADDRDELQAQADEALRQHLATSRT